MRHTPLFYRAPPHAHWARGRYKKAALFEDSENINAILTAIRGIAEQTNLLALNAAIEAEESSAASADLTKLAEQQRRLIIQFKV
ncbi:hypothetical protein AO064_20295 [Pseudomonas marginalis]|uniref:Methyl-accepting transducer domain-containing protein n=1 Tax=Pseudomonas marginalis TaxID=298 RepID=A0A9X5KS88_PSEMA|nr:hypothetical protein AO064_20295 [Pseudomonas marginalis]